GCLIARSDLPPERIFPTPVLNHETSDHLLSLVNKTRTVALKFSPLFDDSNVNQIGPAIKS
ncbi:hypothetical protein, partial [Parasphingorhabdus sp.]|uniref:hypothetical protein n=1 Tax=Parasphingorhabdus sp. TaxID=2709688 RepID=UPI003A8E100F